MRSRRVLTLAITVYLLTEAGAAQIAAHRVPKISIDQNVRVSPAGQSYVEPAVVSAGSARDLVISAQATRPDRPVSPAVFTSQDGGSKWSISELPEVSQLASTGILRRGVDTSLACSSNGSCYLSALMLMKTGQTWGEDPVFVWQSDDGGISWKRASVVKSDTFDHPILNVSSNGDLWLTVAAGKEKSITPQDTGASAFIAVYRSGPDAQQFSPVAFLGPSDLFFEPKKPLIISDGSILVGMTEMARFRGEKKITPIDQSRILAARSPDGGKTFHVPHVVGELGTWDVEATAEFAADLTAESPFRDRIYVAWNRFENGKYNVSLTKSSDKGETWSERLIVSQPGTNTVFSALSVAPNGTVGIVWLSEIGSRPGCWRTWFAASIDGGESFTAPTQISDADSCLDSPATRDITQIGYSGKPQAVLSTWPHAGDYIGLAADSSNAFRAVWIDARSGYFSIYTARVKVE